MLPFIRDLINTYGKTASDADSPGVSILRRVVGGRGYLSSPQVSAEKTSGPPGGFPIL